MIRQIPLPLPHETAMAADDFVVTASNREAAAWVNNWPAWPAHGLIILGPSGSGKTHLLNLWLEKNRGKIVKADALNTNDAGSLAMTNKIIAIDDVGAVAGQRKSEKTLFHLYNLLRETKGALLLTCSRPVAQWNIELADLRSRLLSLPVASIASPDDELLTMLLIKQFHDRQIDVKDGVVAYILPRIERTASAIRSLVTNLDRASLAEGKGVTVGLVKRVLNSATG